MSNLKTEYKSSIYFKLLEDFKYENVHKIPKLLKIQVNCGLGLNCQNKNYLQKAIEDIKTITGQFPKITKAKKSIAGFKIRKGFPLGLTVTLRKEKMYYFLERLIKLTLPRIRDFRGLNPNSFDKNGNYNFGINDQFVFPELNFENINLKFGFNITIVMSSNQKNENFKLLEYLGFPFNK